MGPAPSYLSKLMTLYEPAHSLRSSDIAFLVVSKSRLKNSTVRAPRLWRRLPEEIRQTGSWDSFNSLVKAHVVVIVMLLFLARFLSTLKSQYAINKDYYSQLTLRLRENSRPTGADRLCTCPWDNCSYKASDMLWTWLGMLLSQVLMLLHTDGWVAPQEQYRYSRKAVFTDSVWVLWIPNSKDELKVSLLLFKTTVGQQEFPPLTV